MWKLSQITMVIILLCLLISFSDSGAHVPQGKVLESLTMKSKILDYDVNYSIYLPPDYDRSVRRYPVVYLLHGYSDDETAWVQFGEANMTADQAIMNREIPPMIIVMPDAKVTYYINDHQNKEPYEDMFIKEFIPHIDKKYRTKPEKEFRGISGLSMGGFGSLTLSFRHPDLFAACAAFSAAVRTDDDLAATMGDHLEFCKKLYGFDETTGTAVTEHWHKYSPLHLAETLPEDTLKQIRIYIDCGDDDFLYKGNAMLHIALRNRNIPHEYRIRDGAHNWTYWRTHLKKGLRFIGKSFHR